MAAVNMPAAMHAPTATSCSVSHWSSSVHDAAEYFFCIRPTRHDDFQTDINALFDTYNSALANVGADWASAFACTFFVSDIVNQEALLRRHSILETLTRSECAVTIIQQPPLSGRIALLAHHVVNHRSDSSLATPAPSANGASAPRMHLMRGLISTTTGPAVEQTAALLETASKSLEAEGATWKDVVRTWYYLNDIDRDYTEFNRARNRAFNKANINAPDCFPASTAIGGQTPDPNATLSMDMLVIPGLLPGQSNIITAPQHMNPTLEYGVRFARGRMVLFQDRRHIYISGTASIDTSGAIVHIGDVIAQTRRAIDNIIALLDEANAEPSALRYIIAYIRDAGDLAAVESIINDSPLASAVRIVVHAKVCRPGWLVEIEGFGVDGSGDPRFGAFQPCLNYQ